MLPLGAQTSEPFSLRQGVHRNVMERVLALLFEVVDLRIQNFKLFPQPPLALLKTLQFRFGGVQR